MLFQQCQQVKKEQKLLLDVYGIILSGLQGRLPVFCESLLVRLSQVETKLSTISIAKAIRREGSSTSSDSPSLGTGKRGAGPEALLTWFPPSLRPSTISVMHSPAPKRGTGSLLERDQH